MPVCMHNCRTAMFFVWIEFHIYFVCHVLEIWSLISVVFQYGISYLFNTFYLILYIFLNFRLFLCAIPKFWFHIFLLCLQIIMFLLCVFELSYFLHSICLKLKQSNLLLSSFQTICAWQTWPCLLSAPDHFIQFDVLCMIETQ